MSNQKKIENVKFLMKRQEILMRFQKAIKNIQKLPEIKHNSHFYDVCETFSHIIKPTKPIDVGRLPYYSVTPYCTYSDNKIICIFALISSTMKIFWDFYIEENKDILDFIGRGLTMLEEYVKNGLDAYYVAGKKYNPGFWLETKY